MRLSDFDYELPEELIAQHPARPRDAARMMTLDVRTGGVEHRTFRDLPELLRPRDALALNDTRVIRARMRGELLRSTGTRRLIEVFFAEPMGGDRWRVLCRPGRRIERGDRVVFPGSVEGVFDDEPGAGDVLRVLRIGPTEIVSALLDQHGEIPLPPYIGRASDAEDAASYQTVFSGPPGAVAAPTAGLHFTAETLAAIRNRGVTVAQLTLHVGIGTFLPVRVDDPREHTLWPERFELSEAAAGALETARGNGGRVIAVGTTVTRTLEYVFRKSGAFRAETGATDLFILPGFRFQAVDALLTNFHLPKSTLLMLVAAFAGREKTLEAYREAVKQRYRFYSYGDCMLITR
jgi:S-adenosylmethionine:tRNA ribosyltransferase-isomerase